MRILLDAGIRISDGWIIYDYRYDFGSYQELRFKDTAENRVKLEEFIAQRSLTPDDLRRPKPHPDPRPIRERISQDGRTSSGDMSERDPRRMSPEDRAKHLREWIRDHNEVRNKMSHVEQVEAQAEALEIEAETANPEMNAAAVEHATWGFLTLAMDPNVPQFEVSAAAKRLEVAHLSKTQYAIEDREYRQRVKQNAELAKANIEGLAAQQAAKLAADVAALDSAAWVDAPAETPAN